jgi:hypothetical protein
MNEFPWRRACLFFSFLGLEVGASQATTDREIRKRHQIISFKVCNQLSIIISIISHEVKVPLLMVGTMR